jgi:hypothetical protein
VRRVNRRCSGRRGLVAGVAELDDDAVDGFGEARVAEQVEDEVVLLAQVVDLAERDDLVRGERSRSAEAVASAGAGGAAMAGVVVAIAAMVAASTRPRVRICMGRAWVSGEATQVRSRGRAQRRTANAKSAR